jgi:predicted dienelactone hydrolase
VDVDDLAYGIRGGAMNRLTRTLTAVAFLAMAEIVHAGPAAVPAEKPVGFQVTSATDTNGQAFAVGVWYPADVQVSTSTQSGPTVMGAIQNAPVAGKGLPLVVISHGNGGGLTSHIDLAMALAGAGYVVAAPMYPGDNFKDDSASGLATLYSGRNRQLRLAIDHMLTKWKGHDAVDPERIGAFGMSAGGFTVLTVAGAQPDMGLIPRHCSQSAEFICEVLRHYKSSLLNADAPAAEPMQVSPNVKAIVVAAPGLGFTLTPAALSRVKVPVQLWSGEKDDKVPYATNGKFVVEALGSKVEFHSVPNAGHLSFLAPCGPVKVPEICTDPEGFDRTAFHATMNAEVVRFFDANLKR